MLQSARIARARFPPGLITDPDTVTGCSAVRPSDLSLPPSARQPLTGALLDPQAELFVPRPPRRDNLADTPPPPPPPTPAPAPAPDGRLPAADAGRCAVVAAARNYFRPAHYPHRPAPPRPPSPPSPAGLRPLSSAELTRHRQ